MEKNLQLVCNALALAGCILEQKNREDWCCPYHYQDEPRVWSRDECHNCDYSFAIKFGPKMKPIVSYDPEFRAACWVEYLLWEANSEEIRLEGTQ